MGEDQFSGATRDPIALLEQLLGQVAAVRRDQAELKEQFQELRQELKGEIITVREELKGEIASVREELKGEIITVREELKGEIITVREELKGEIASVRAELKGDMTELKVEVKSLGGDFSRFAAGLDREQAGFKAEVEQVVDRKAMLGQYQLRDEFDRRWDRLERRISQLEEAESRRKAGETA